MMDNLSQGATETAVAHPCFSYFNMYKSQQQASCKN